MNNAKMWLVVKPTVGIPLFLSAVAIGSFAVHVAVLTNTPWVSDFLTGNEMSTAAIQTENSVQNASVIFDEQKSSYNGGSIEATVVLPDGRKATAYFDADPKGDATKTAMAAPGTN